MKQTPFLTAEWRNLIMANYEIDPAVLQAYLPCHTELDSFNGKHYVSLVGFLFTHVKLHGISIPFHTCFEEFNLRFYVRYKQEGVWKRGAVFIKEIVPKHMISLVANAVYKENYATHKMKHSRVVKDNNLEVAYYWKVGHEWNHLKVIAHINAEAIEEGSAEEFITEHYWGYTFINKACSGQYEVRHPRWKVHQVKRYDIYCNVKALYGEAFSEALQAKPASVFLADGSAIEVMKGTRLRK